MCRATVSTLLAAALMAVPGCDKDAARPAEERPAPSNAFVVTTNAGTRFSGTAARIDIRYVDADKPPVVEISISAAGDSGRTWSALTAAPPEFLKTPNLTARVVDDRIAPGTATVQTSRDNLEATAAPAGLLSLRLYNGRLTGEASHMDNEHAATFDGPFIVTCAVPAAAMAGDVAQPAPTAGEAPPTLTVDEAFESALCRPYATLGGWNRR